MSTPSRFHQLDKRLDWTELRLSALNLVRRKAVIELLAQFAVRPGKQGRMRLLQSLGLSILRFKNAVQVKNGLE